MAKLEGVKVIDMQDGEVTKITYEGEEYSYISAEEEKGDIALVVDDWGNQEIGDYYDVIKEDHPMYDDDSDVYVHIRGKRKHASCFRKRVRLFRKAASELKKVKRPAKIGEKIVITEAAPMYGQKYECGDVLIVIAEDVISKGDIYVEGVNRYIDYFEYHVIEDSEGKEEVEKPSFEAGDYAKVIDETYCNDINRGTIVKVTGESDFDSDYRIELLDGSDYDYAKLESLEKVDVSDKDLVFLANGRKPGEYKIGDVVRVTDGYGSLVPTGTIGIISRVRRGGFLFAVDTHDITHSNYQLASNMEPIAFVEQRVDKIA